MKKHFENHWGKMILGVAAILLVGSIVYAQYAGQQANEGVVIEPHIKGNPDAAVTLVEYSDFQCPACAQAAPIVDEIMNEYGEDIRFEYRHFPLINIHPNAVPAARATIAAAQQGAFWPMHDILFANQQQWSSAASPNALFIQYADELGLDTALFRRHLGASRIARAVTDDFNAARNQGFTGTPTFVLNGERMQFETFEDFRQQIAAATGRTVESPTATTTDESVEVEFGI